LSAKILEPGRVVDLKETEPGGGKIRAFSFLREKKGERKALSKFVGRPESGCFFCFLGGEEVLTSSQKKGQKCCWRVRFDLICVERLG